MSGRRSRRPPSLDLSVSSREPTPPPSTSDNETDDDTMTTSSGSYSQRPISVALPKGPYCVKRPTLSEILSNNAPPPYTLSAFMAYLSQNHCLETLEFTMDASRYRKHYNALKAANGTIAPDSDLCQYVKMLWQRLLDAYIVPNGPREVNLPYGIRENLLNLSNSRTPPSPDALDQAVNKIYELMEDSVLLPFLNSCIPCQQYSSPWEAPSSEDLYLRGSLDDRILRKKSSSSPPPPQLDFISHSYSAPSTSQRPQRAGSPFSASLGWHRHSTHFPNSWGGLSASGSGDSMVTDDSLGTASTSDSPMTPPSTPPTSDSAPNHGSPKYAKTAEKGWKKVTGKLSWKKKSSLIFSDAGSL